MQQQNTEAALETRRLTIYLAPEQETTARTARDFDAYSRYMREQIGVDVSDSQIGAVMLAEGLRVRMQTPEFQAWLDRQEVTRER